MISGFIVTASLAFAVVFVLFWCLRPGFRRRLEYPKHDFQLRLERYDRQCRDEAGPDGIVNDERK